MSGIDNAKLAVDANFDVNGIDATYHSTWPSAGVPCKVLPSQDDLDVGIGGATASNPKAVFAVRKSEASPVQGGFLIVPAGGIRYRVNEAPVPDDFRLTYRCKTVKV